VTGSRGLDAATLTEIAKSQITTAHLIDIVFDTPAYITDHSRNVTYNSNLYISGGDLIDFGPVSETSDLRVSAVQMQLTGVSNTYRQLLLSGDHIDRQIIIRRAIFNTNDALIDNPVVIRDGRIQGFDILETLTSSIVTIDIASHMADFQKTAGRRTNSHSQNIFFPNDTGMEFSSEVVDEIIWGRTI
jgi:hypothetical protein